MNKRSWQRHKWTVFAGAAGAVPAFVFGMWIFWRALYTVPAPPVLRGASEVHVETRYALDQIAGIERVFTSARPLLPATGIRTETSIVTLPHHTLLSEELSGFWKDLAKDGVPSAIVVIGPAHKNQGKGTMQFTEGTWVTPLGDVTSNISLVERVARIPGASLDEQAFKNEHSVGVHMPYIAALFPGTPVLSVIAPSTSGEAEARLFTQKLEHLLPKGSLVVLSTDFSHGLSVEESDVRDAEIERLVAARDFSEIEKLSPEYVDSPFSLMTFFLLVDDLRVSPRLLWHTNSGTILHEPEAPGTSYFVWKGTVPQEDDAVLTLAVAGDMMLGRDVARMFAKTTLEDAYTEAQSVLSPSDLAFANLESVLTSTDGYTGKSIFFKGDPARVDVLNYLGLTHVSVSNNHVDDYGKAGWADSKKNVAASGVVPVGGYANDGETIMAEADGQTIAFLAYDDTIRRVDLTLLQERVQDAARRADHVAVSFHWGVEYVHTPTSRQVELAHAAIDAGADVILGTHPHVLETIETYKEGIIFYSLGNFIFDQIGSDENESLVVQLSFSEKGNTVDLVPMRIEKGFPRIATEEERVMTLSRLAGWSDGGLKIEIEEGKIFW